MKKFTSKTQKVGEIGEKIAEMFLVKHGFTILERNFTCKAGEIDIICKKADKVHFIEVKSVISRGGAHACPPSRDLGSRRETRYNPFQNVTRLTSPAASANGGQARERYNPFNNISNQKILKCIRTIEFWFSFHGKHVSRETCWQMDGISVFINSLDKKASVEYLEHINII
ncbi:MAG: YraN family protein [Candidatus Pacebacteria bacterium]|nr:YraN family protein [Candidatus Paceibacterota bacterium]